MDTTTTKRNTEMKKYIEIEKINWENVMLSIIVYFLISIPLVGPFMVLLFWDFQYREKYGFSQYKKRVKYEVKDEK